MSSESVFSQIGTVFMTLVGFIVILYLAYISTKYIGKKYSLRGSGGKNIKVLENCSVGRNKSFAIIKAGNKTILVGITDTNINFLCELDENELSFNSSSGDSMEFSKAFCRVLENKFGRKTENNRKEKYDESEKQTDE